MFSLVFKSRRDALLLNTQFQELVWKADLQKGGGFGLGIGLDDL